MNLNKQLLLDLIQDMKDYAQFKQINCPPIYILGGAGAIIGDYFERATVDIDILDLDYPA